MEYQKYCARCYLVRQRHSCSSLRDSADANYSPDAERSDVLPAFEMRGDGSFVDIGQSDVEHSIEGQWYWDEQTQDVVFVETAAVLADGSNETYAYSGWDNEAWDQARFGNPDNYCETNCLESETLNTWRYRILSSTSQGEDWKLRLSRSYETYVRSVSIGEITDYMVDPSQPVIQTTDPDVDNYLAVFRSLDAPSFTETELSGNWHALAVLPGSAAACTDNRRNCWSQFEFSGDGSGQVRGQTFSWAINPLGALEVFMDSGEGLITFTKYRDHGDELFQVLSITDTNGKRFAEYGYALAEDPASVEQAIAQGAMFGIPLIKEFSYLDPTTTRREDGVPLWPFSITLRDGGEAYNTTYGGGDPFSVGARNGVWTSEGSAIDIRTCGVSSQSGATLTESEQYPACSQDLIGFEYNFQRNWDLLAAKGQRDGHYSLFVVREHIELQLRYPDSDSWVSASSGTVRLPIITVYRRLGASTLMTLTETACLMKMMLCLLMAMCRSRVAFCAIAMQMV